MGLGVHGVCVRAHGVSWGISVCEAGDVDVYSVVSVYPEMGSH